MLLWSMVWNMLKYTLRDLAQVENLLSELFKQPA